MLDSDCAVVSPHFDDAVLCLGGALARARGPARVVTVCAGVPGGPGADAAEPPPSVWDRRSGFRGGADAARTRIAEDLAAARRLGFDARHLGFYDAPYAPAACGPDAWPVEDLVAALHEQLAGMRAVYAPAGIGGHPDHVRTRDVTLRVAAALAVPEIRLYADLPYAMRSPLWGTPRFYDPGHPVLEPLATLAPAWRLAAPEYTSIGDADWPAKRAGVLDYASQMAPLTGDFPGFLAWPGPLQTEATWVVTAAAEVLP